MEGYEEVPFEEREIWLLRRIDELKHEVDCAEAETERVERRKEEWKTLHLNQMEYEQWLDRNHPDIKITYQVLKRMGEL